jgi:hypothetical protein
LPQRAANPTGSGNGGSRLVAVMAVLLDLLERSRSDEDIRDEEQRAESRASENSQQLVVANAMSKSV